MENIVQKIVSQAFDKAFVELIERLENNTYDLENKPLELCNKICYTELMKCFVQTALNDYHNSLIKILAAQNIDINFDTPEN